ncbi:hypothetical protein DFH09DRAFT_1100416 [Mycena vulgaris]|nr:hypothetical protein DFH09DRAFT_1100416 [Mycena vulgaris]
MTVASNSFPAFWSLVAAILPSLLAPNIIENVPPIQARTPVTPICRAPRRDFCPCFSLLSILRFPSLALLESIGGDCENTIGSECPFKETGLKISDGDGVGLPRTSQPLGRSRSASTAAHGVVPSCGQALPMHGFQCLLGIAFLVPTVSFRLFSVGQ